ncbi:bifunctional 2-polyprenyl-6-hydroxyphenol methylase/3-demethylubiquinol 3-O-methyltransferase UbiG [Seonamhaeicola sp. ML3]|uniref:class I SAM-dependent methyltransferase n=1 Tax=Seonamhaeicola sp. ML3 TaxID=2937786 RepID=UPI00200ED421|nr:class I SAM-dependent methyltransferase [Seonamhaeicola sp. ML3]
MSQIYEKHLWGGKDHDFYSGYGSHDSAIVEPYVNKVSEFLKSFDTPLTVCDLGCGDFNVGHRLIKYSKKYIAIDIVDSLVTRNKQLFNNPKLEFLCLDISKDNLPEADCIILRQVLQHLSNNEIHKIVKKLKTYKYVIVTEHIPNETFIPNKDIISGQGIRLKQNSGINLTEAPFYFKIKAIKILDDFVLKNNLGRIVTCLYLQF